MYRNISVAMLTVTSKVARQTAFKGTNACRCVTWVESLIVLIAACEIYNKHCFNSDNTYNFMFMFYIVCSVFCHVKYNQTTSMTFSLQ